MLNRMPLTNTDLYLVRRRVIYLHWKEHLKVLVMKSRDEKLDHNQIKDAQTEFDMSYKTKLTLNFIKPIHIPVGCCHTSKTRHTSMSFHFWISDEIMRRFKRGGSSGYYLPDNIYENIKSWEVSIVDDSMSYEDFKKRFDMRFITEIELQRTWANKSPQHGGEYKKTDFKSMSTRGRKLFLDFLCKFESVRVPTENYKVDYGPSTSTKDVLHERYNPWSDKGRTISIEHHYPSPYVLYSTEDKMGGKEKCYIVANKNEVLHLEND